jgi:hypothetical protein
MRYALVLVILGLAGPAFAGGEATLHLVVEGSLDRESLRSEVATELGVDVALVAGACERPCLEISIGHDRTATLRFAPRSGASRERAVMLDNDPTQWPLVITLLAGNIVRDEAADLLARLPPSVPAVTDGARATSRSSTVPERERTGGRERERTVTIMMSPLALIAPIADLSVEVRVAKHLGLAAVGAVGRWHACGSDAGYVAMQLDACDGPSGTAVVGGARFDYYIMHAFSGVHAGIAVTYGHNSAFDSTGLRTVAYLGYKLLAANGFTLAAQAGIAYDAVTSVSRTGADAMASSLVQQRTLGAHVGLQVGWSF